MRLTFKYFLSSFACRIVVLSYKLSLMYDLKNDRRSNGALKIPPLRDRRGAGLVMAGTENMRACMCSQHFLLPT